MRGQGLLQCNVVRLGKRAGLWERIEGKECTECPAPKTVLSRLSRSKKKKVSRSGSRSAYTPAHTGLGPWSHTSSARRPITGAARQRGAPHSLARSAAQHWHHTPPHHSTPHTHTHTYHTTPHYHRAARNIDRPLSLCISPRLARCLVHGTRTRTRTRAGRPSLSPSTPRRLTGLAGGAAKSHARLQQASLNRFAAWPRPWIPWIWPCILLPCAAA